MPLLHHGEEEALEHLGASSLDTWLGMTFSNLIALCIMLTTAATLNAQGIVTIESAATAGGPGAAPDRRRLRLRALHRRHRRHRPARDPGARGLGGVRGRGNLPAGPSAWGSTLLEARGFYTILSPAPRSCGVGLGFTSLDPIKALIWSAVVNGVIAVPIMVVMMLLAAETPEVMGQLHGAPAGFACSGWFSTARDGCGGDRDVRDDVGPVTLLSHTRETIADPVPGPPMTIAPEQIDDELYHRIQQDLLDDLDEELEMEVEDRGPGGEPDARRPDAGGPQALLPEFQAAARLVIGQDWIVAAGRRVLSDPGDLDPSRGRPKASRCPVHSARIPGGSSPARSAGHPGSRNGTATRAPARASGHHRSR